jgi:cytidylate kinase
MHSSRNGIIIALDGPAGSGKSTTARIVAERLGYLYIDTGAMYRAITLAVLREDADISEEGLRPILEQYSVRLVLEPAPLFAGEIRSNSSAVVEKDQSAVTPTITLQRTQLIHHRENYHAEDVSEDIRLQEVTLRVSAVSALPSVRAAMTEQQRAMGKLGGVVMDGRDIGTVVFPEAELKVFLVASVEERARRRLKELQSKAERAAAQRTGTAAGTTLDTTIELPTFEELCRQLQERDKQDSERAISPLRKADDAIEIDTSHLTIEEQSAQIVALARQRLQSLHMPHL